MTQDATKARQRLLEAALEVFAAKGYASASTREICRLAEANVSAIHYYFGDKASLYRELFETLDPFQHLPTELGYHDTPIEHAVLALYRHLLGFAASPSHSHHARALFLREHFQPTGILGESRRRGLTPFYSAVLSMLQYQFGLREPDAATRLLAFSLLGLGTSLLMGRDAVDELAPEILEDKEHTAMELAQQALVLIEHERARRAFRKEASL